MSRVYNLVKELFHSCASKNHLNCKITYTRYSGPMTGDEHVCTCACHGDREIQKRSRKKMRKKAA